ncbi:MAG: sulfate adenylyltransferase subunit 2 [Flavobacterium sp.]
MALFSNASTIEEVMLENKQSKSSERGSRLDDKRSEAALEQRKKGGYF